MSFERFLNHTCDIYHICEKTAQLGYGQTVPSFSYPATPDMESVPCHFQVRNPSITVNQREPINIMDNRRKMTLPIGTDVRINDKIVDCATGEQYVAERPMDVHGHHLYVYVKMAGEDKAL